MKKNVLTLTVSKQWFDMIVTGEKTEEYREIKPYWVARLFQNNSNIVDVRNLASALAGRTDLLKKYIDAQRIVFKQYTHVLFINGYRKDSPRVKKEIESITIGKPKKGLCPDKWLDTEFFIIKFKQRMNKTDLHSSLLFLMIKLEEAKGDQMADKNFVAALTEVLRYFRDNGELKKAYDLQKDSLTDIANSPWAKLVIGMLTSKMQEDKVDAEVPNINALIKENTSDEFIEKKINDVLGDDVELKEDNKK